MKISQIIKLIPQKLGKKPSLEKVVKVHGFGPYGMSVEEGEPKMAQLPEYSQDTLLRIKESIKKVGEERGVALIVDDTSESTHIIKVRPRISWHGGAESLVVESV